jgi:hypothetical protein
MGKSSLVSRWRSDLEAEGVRVIHVDVAGEMTCPRSATDWVARLEEAIAADIGTSGMDYRAAPSETGRAAAPYLTELLLSLGSNNTGHRKTLLVLDETDSIGSYPFGRGVLAALRATQSRLRQQLKRHSTSLCLIGLRSMHELGSPLHGTDAPIRPGIVMEDFDDNHDARMAIASALELDYEPGMAVASRILHHSGGQPFLTMILADLVKRHGIDSSEGVDDVVDLYLKTQRAAPSDLLLHIEDFLMEHRFDAFAALTTWTDLLEGRRGPLFPDTPGARLLRLAGLVVPTQLGFLPKGPILRRHFDEEWTRLHSLVLEPRRCSARGRRL